MTSTVLTQLERRGAHVIVPPGTVDPRALASHLLALRVAGHAVVADEVFDSDGRSLGVRVTHYLTCRRCQK